MTNNKSYYININTGECNKDFFGFLNSTDLKYINPENFEYNNLIGVLKRCEAKPIIGDFIPIHKGMIWDNLEKKVLDPMYIPNVFVANIEVFLNAAASFFEEFKGKKIGVQLSGGLDSSIIIGLLKYFQIPFYLVGMITDRYEFRTERYIQEILSKCAVESALIDYENHLPLSNLYEVPKHQYPNMLVNNYSSNNAMALECKRLGVKVLLTGKGGDNVFAEEIPLKPEKCTWIPQSFGDNWLSEMIYEPCGIELMSFYENTGILDSIYNLRKGQKEDNSKIWARKYFKDFIPQELVDYSYCADFWGIYISGLLKAVPQIKQLCKKAFDLTGNNYFSDNAIEALLNQNLLNVKKEMYQKIEARIALAVYLNSINKQS